MKKLKIFPKTFLYTFTILGCIILIVHISIYFLFPIFYLDDQKHELNTKANMLVESLSRVDSSSVESVLSIYAKNNKITALLKGNGSSGDIKLGEQLEIDKSSTNNSIIIEDRKAVTKDGKIITFQIISSTEMVKEATRITLQFLPYTLMTTILFSVIFSYFYSKRLVRPLIEIAETTKKMENLDRKARFKVHTSDEKGEVGMQINRVYEQLLNVIDNLEEKNQTMIKMEKMKVDFLRSASHELKTPLAGLRIILENMKYGIGKYKDKDKYLLESIDIVDYMTETVTEMLTLSKIQEWTSSDEEICIDSEIRKIVSDYAILATDKEIEITIDIENRKISMGKAAFEKVISNIIGNAVKYTDNKGKINIYTFSHQLIIENTCIPLPKEEISKVFDIFYHRHNEKQSNGLGLYIVKTILDNYGFHYSFEPNGSKGMRFIIEF